LREVDVGPAIQIEVEHRHATPHRVQHARRFGLWFVAIVVAKVQADAGGDIFKPDAGFCFHLNADDRRMSKGGKSLSDIGARLVGRLFP
jgi:hypothetical protein